MLFARELIDITRRKLLETEAVATTYKKIKGVLRECADQGLSSRDFPLTGLLKHNDDAIFYLLRTDGLSVTAAYKNPIGEFWIIRWR